MKDIAICPDPLPLARLALGEGTAAEFEALDEHLARCVACRDEWNALLALQARQGVGEWSLAVGAETDLPDTLWRSIEAARLMEPATGVPAVAALVRDERAPLRLGLRMGPLREAMRGAGSAVDALAHAAGRAARSIDWLSLLGGPAKLVPVSAAPVRGTAAPAPASEVPAIRLTSGTRDILVRRGDERLTVVVTDSGEPLPGCRVALSGPDGTRDERTDLTGIVVFRPVPAGDYRLDIEEARS